MSWLAGRSGFSVFHISRVANRRQNPSPTFQKLIAEALGVSKRRIWGVRRAEKKAA